MPSLHKKLPQPNPNISAISVRRRIGHMLVGFGFPGANDWLEDHPVEIEDLQLVELAMRIESEFDVEFRDDLLPDCPVLGDFVRMVIEAMQN